MKGGDNRLAFLYVASYLFLVVLASINMFIAILNDYFMKHQEQNARVSPIHNIMIMIIAIAQGCAPPPVVPRTFDRCPS